MYFSWNPGLALQRGLLQNSETDTPLLWPSSCLPLCSCHCSAVQHEVIYSREPNQSYMLSGFTKIQNCEPSNLFSFFISTQLQIFIVRINRMSTVFCPPLPSFPFLLPSLPPSFPSLPPSLPLSLPFLLCENTAINIHLKLLLHLFIVCVLGRGCMWRSENNLYALAWFHPSTLWDTRFKL